jgi:hypothetical protein
MVKQISNLADVEKLAGCLKAELGLGFHPDDPFEDYINIETKEPIYTPEQARLRNDLMNQAFLICERENVDIYETTGRIIVKDTPMEGMFD